MGLFGSSSSTTATKYIGIPVQTSIKGATLPKVYGTTKAGCNLIDYLDFNADPHTTEAGKGGSYKSTTYTYKATLLLGICSGVIAGVRKIWRDQSTFTTINGSSAIAQAGLTGLATGALGQAPWGYLTTSHPDHAIGYSGLAYVYASNYDLNDSATIPNHSFEVQSSIRQVVSGTTLDDANPAAILADHIPSIPRWPAGALGDLTDYGNYCLAAGLLLSPLLDSQRQVSEFVKEILTASNSDCVWSDGQFKVAPYGDTQVTGNGVTWSPNLTPVYDFDLGDLYANADEDPVKWDQTRPSNAYNSVQVEFFDRLADYATDVMPARDQANIDEFGERKEDPVSLHSICDRTVAAQVAQIRVQRTCNMRKTCQFEVSEKYGLLEPHIDLVTVPLRNGSRKLVRITSYEEHPDEGSIVYNAEEMLVGVSHAATYTRQGAQGVAVNYNIDPGDTAMPALFDVPVQLAQVIGLETWLAVCSASANAYWGGCQVWISTDGVTYSLNQTIVGPSRMGVLTATFPAGSDPDTTDTLAIDLTNSGGVLESGTQADADNGTTLCFVDGEYVAYRDATLTSSFNYALGGYLRRGKWGSLNSSHAVGSSFVRLDGSVAKIPYTAADVGRTLYIKLLSFNVYGQALQQLSAVTAYTHVVGGPPTVYAPSNLQASPAIRSVQLTWTNAVNVGQQVVEIWRSATSSFSGASKVGEAAAYATAYPDTGAIVSGTSYWYWIRARDIAGNESQYYPSTSSAGVMASVGQAGTSDINTSAVTTPKVAADAVVSATVVDVHNVAKTDDGSYSAPADQTVRCNGGNKTYWTISGLGTPKEIKLSFKGSYSPTSSTAMACRFWFDYQKTDGSWVIVPTGTTQTVYSTSSNSSGDRPVFCPEMTIYPPQLTGWSGAVRAWVNPGGPDVNLLSGVFSADVQQQ